MIARIWVVLAAMMIVVGSALPASAARNAEDLLIAEGPAGYTLLPPQPGVTGPITLQDIAKLAGLEARADVDSSSGFSRGWSDGTSGLVAYALTFDDPTVAAGFLKSLLGDVREGVNAQPLAGIEGGYAATVTDPATGIQSEFAAFGRGDAVFFLVGTPGQRALVTDGATRQSVLAGPGSPPAADSPYDWSSKIGMITGGIVLVLLVAALAQHLTKRRQQGVPGARGSNAPVPAGTWSIGPPAS